MSLLDDEEILIANDNPVFKNLAENRAKYLSYGFWCKKILEPAIKNIKNDCCDLDLYVAHPSINKFISCCNSICSVNKTPVCLFDCRNIITISDPALFIQHLPDKSIVIFANPSIMINNTIKKNSINILFNCWKDKEIDVEQLLMDNNAENYIIDNGKKTLYRDNYGIIYIDLDTNKNFDFHTLSGTKCYGDFFIPGCNFTFMNICYNDEIVNIKELVDYGEKVLNSRK